MIPEASPLRAGVQAISAEAVSPDRGVNRDRLLRCSRRADWRFLLSGPRLRRVAFVGRPAPFLLEALREFADSVDVLDAAATAAIGDGRDFDLLVVRSASPDEVLAASRRLAIGGDLYWEIERAWGKASASRARLAGIRSMLGEAGFADVRAHWHRPDFEACLEIIPLEEDGVLDWVFRSRPRGWRGAVRLAVGSGLRRTGLLDRLVPCWSILARRYGVRGERE